MPYLVVVGHREAEPQDGLDLRTRLPIRPGRKRLDTLAGVMRFFYLILGGLVAFRLSLLISKEDGPAYVFRKIRKLPLKSSSAKEGLSCEWCMSIWTGALVALYLWLIGRIPGEEWPLYWLGLSAIAIICNQQWTKGS